MLIFNNRFLKKIHYYLKRLINNKKIDILAIIYIFNKYHFIFIIILIITIIPPIFVLMKYFN